MQMNTIIRLGSLAFDVAQDDKVRELVGMVHKGGKRRGLWANTPTATANSAKTVAASDTSPKTEAKPAPKPPKKQETQPIPFGPSWTQLPSWTKAPQNQGFPVPSAVGKYFTTGNAKKALKLAGDLGHFLIK